MQAFKRFLTSFLLKGNWSSSVTSLVLVGCVGTLKLKLMLVEIEELQVTLTMFRNGVPCPTPCVSISHSMYPMSQPCVPMPPLPDTIQHSLSQHLTQCPHAPIPLSPCLTPCIHAPSCVCMLNYLYPCPTLCLHASLSVLLSHSLSPYVPFPVSPYPTLCSHAPPYISLISHSLCRHVTILVSPCPSTCPCSTLCSHAQPSLSNSTPRFPIVTLCSHAHHCVTILLSLCLHAPLTLFPCPIP